MKGLLFTYAMTYGGAVISLFNPWYGFLIYVCFAVIKPPALWPWAVSAGSYSRIIGIAFLVGWAINGFGDARLGRARPIVLALLGYFLWVSLSTAFSSTPERGLPFVEYLAKIVLPFVAGVTLVHTRQQLEQLLLVILASCAFLAYEANLAYLGGLSVESYGFLQMDNNTFSILMATSFGLALILGAADIVTWRRYLFFGIAAAMAHVPMLAFSRGGILGVLVAALVAIAVVPKNRRTWQMIGAGVVVTALLAGPSVVKEFATTFDSQDARDASAQSRIDLWIDCVDVMLKHPVLGIGQDCWPLIAESYGWPRGKEAHSLWFQVAAELGIPGVSFLLLFYGLTIHATWRASRRTDLFWMPWIARMMLVSLVGFAVSAAFVTVDGFELPYYVALLGTCSLKVADAERAEAHDVELMELSEHSDEHPAGWQPQWAGAHS